MVSKKRELGTFIAKHMNATPKPPEVSLSEAAAVGRACLELARATGVPINGSGDPHRTGPGARAVDINRYVRNIASVQARGQDAGGLWIELRYRVVEAKALLAEAGKKS